MGNINNMEEENKKAPQEEEQKDEDKKKYTLKVIISTVIVTLLLIALLLLGILFGMKKCSGRTSEPTSSEIIEKDTILHNRFLEIVQKQMDADEYHDEVTDVVSIMYQENYPTNFTIDIVAKSATKLYYYYAENAEYGLIDGSKDTYSNMVEYLKKDTSNFLDGDITLNSETISNVSVATTKQGRWSIGVNAADEYHLSGWYLENNEFHVYYKRILLNLGEDPFATGVGDQIIKSEDILFGYYKGLTL